jgi:hypothetical protein
MLHGESYTMLRDETGLVKPMVQGYGESWPRNARWKSAGIEGKCTMK